MVDCHQISHEEVAMLSPDESVVFRAFEGEILSGDLGRFNVLLDQFEELISEIFIDPFAYFQLVELIVAG